LSHPRRAGGDGAARDRLPAAIADAVAAFGIVPHFRPIARGILDLRDLVFSSPSPPSSVRRRGGAQPPAGRVMAMRRPHRRRLAGIATLALALAVTVGLNLWADSALRGFGWISARIAAMPRCGHRRGAGRLRQPVTLRLVVSGQIAAASPALAGYARRVEARLEDYVAAGGGQLTLQRETPEPFSDVEDRAVADGLLGLPLTRGGTRSISAWSAAAPPTGSPSPSCGRRKSRRWTCS